MLPILQINDFVLINNFKLDENKVNFLSNLFNAKRVLTSKRSNLEI